MTQFEKLTRMANIAQMDATVREFNDEDLVFEWLTYGVPDHNGEVPLDDLEWFAESDAEYADLCKLFEELLKAENA